MAYARIVTRVRGTVIRCAKWQIGTFSIATVDRIANTLDSIIAPDADILKVEVDYTGCVDE